MKTLKKIMLWTMVIAIYLNIGHALGTYIHYNLESVVPQTTLQKIMQGGWYLFSSSSPCGNPASDQAFCSALWPILVVVIIGDWLIYGLYHFVVFLLGLIVAGGIAKALGLS